MLAQLINLIIQLYQSIIGYTHGDSSTQMTQFSDLPIQPAPEDITYPPIAKPKPLYLDWAQHSDCGYGITYFLRPSNRNEAPAILWPGESAIGAAENSLPAPYIKTPSRWYPSNRSHFH